MSININKMNVNLWNCIYCDRQFPKEGKWETHQKITFTEGQMKSLGRTYMDMNDILPPGLSESSIAQLKSPIIRTI